MSSQVSNVTQASTNETTNEANKPSANIVGTSSHIQATREANKQSYTSKSSSSQHTLVNSNPAVQSGSGKMMNFVSGLVSGLVSVTFCNPLDITRVRLNIMSSPSQADGNKYSGFFNTLRIIGHEEGFKGFYAGYRINATAIPLFYSLFFTCYQSGKSYLSQRGYSENQTYLLSTMLSGILCNLVTNPIWVVRTRVMLEHLQPESKKYGRVSALAIMGRIVREEGIKSLFRGITASLMSVSNAVIYFFTYEKLKHQIRLYTGQETVATLGILVSSVLCKMLATSITYPFVTLRTIYYDHREIISPNLIPVVKSVWSRKGLAGFYSGLAPDLARILPANAITFMVYQKIKQLWREMEDEP